MKTSHFALAVLTASLLCVGNAVGQDEKKAESDAAVVAFEATLAKAKGGDADAMFNLGNMYFTGRGVIKDEKEAVKWYRKAAELGVATAMSNLGVMYANGEGVIEDNVEAYGGFNVAAANGNKVAAENREKIKNDMTQEQSLKGQKRSREIMKSITKNNPPETTDSDQTN